MWLHPRMRSTTNFFLTNLAIADFCVIIFCVLQNLSLYLAQSWIFGNFLCKMYNFIHALSYTSSVMILVVNCIERYIAIMSPFKAKTILRQRNLMIALFIVWISSGIYCCPRLLYFRAVTHKLNNAYYEVICLADRGMFDSRTFDTISFILLYLVPLTVISVLYLRIARYLWVNGVQIEHTIRRHTVDPVSNAENQGVQRSLNSSKAQKSFSSTALDTYSTYVYEASKEKPCEDATPKLRCHRGASKSPLNAQLGQVKPKQNEECSYRSKDIIQRWRKVVKLLVAVVTCFAVCNLPYHLRKMLLYYYSGYKITTNEALLATPLTQALTYLNSALNPILYCFMSHNFRFCIREVLSCQYTWRGRRRPTKRNPNANLRMKHLEFNRERNKTLQNFAPVLDKF